MIPYILYHAMISSYNTYILLLIMQYYMSLWMPGAVIYPTITLPVSYT